MDDMWFYAPTKTESRTVIPETDNKLGVPLYVDGFTDGYRQGTKDALFAEIERNKGWWIIHEGQDMVCSSCKKRYQVAEIRAADIAKEFKFCPNCGAIMENGHDRRN